MAIFRYTMIKFLKTPSTWILFIFCGGLLFWIAGLPFHTWGRNWAFKSVAEQRFDMETAFIASYSALGSILALSIALFAGFKGAQVFRDEIEDGSFLVILSKPLSRNKIIFWKWLAFICLFLVYGAALVLLHAFGSLLEMKGSFVRNKIFEAMPLEFLIITIFIIIFSSMALIVSSFLSSRGVMGVMFVFGLGIVFSQLISAFTYVPSFTKFDVSNHISRTETANELYARKSTLTNKQLATGDISKLFLTKQNLYVTNPNAIDTYKYLWHFDLSYHINMMDSIIVDTVLHNNGQQRKNTFGIPQKVEFNGYYDATELTNMENFSFLPGMQYENVNILLNQFQLSYNAQLWKATSYLLAMTSDYINTNLTTIAKDRSKLTINIFNNNFYNDQYTTSALYNKQTGSTIATYWKNIMSSGTVPLDNKATIKISENHNLLKLMKILDNSDYHYTPSDSILIQESVKNNIAALLMGYFETDKIRQTLNTWPTNHKHTLRVNYYNLLTTGTNELSKLATHLNIKVKTNLDGTLTKASIAKLQNHIIKVKYVNFTNRYKILAVYIVASIIMIPVTFIIIRRKDFV